MAGKTAIKKKIVIVVSGPPGAGSTTVAKRLAKRLNFRYFVPGEVHKKLGDSKEESEAALFAWKTRKGKSKKFHNELDELQIEEAKKGNIVVCGKLSIHFLRDLSDFKVWLDVPLKIRAKRAAERDGANIKKSTGEIIARERIERNEWKKIYGFDYFCQKKIADLVLDSSDLTIGQTVNKIMKFIVPKITRKNFR